MCTNSNHQVTALFNLGQSSFWVNFSVVNFLYVLLNFSRV